MARPLLVVLAALLVPSAARAVDVPIANASFEAPAIPAGTFSTTAAPPGWSVHGSGIDFGFRTIGVLDPAGSTLYAQPVPDGENVGVVFLLDNPGNQTVPAGIEAGMEQTLGTALATATRYVLTVEVGNIANDATPPNDQFQFAGFPGYRIELTAGGVAVAADEGTLLPGEGAFLTSTVAVTIGTGHPLAGQLLGVRLVNLNAAPGIEVNFDDVRLDASAAAGFASFCDASDGSLASCPCANPGAPDAGCDIAQGTGGVALAVAAQQTAPVNRATLVGTGFPAAAAPVAIVIRSPALGAPVVFGDGLRCVGLPLVRLAAGFASGGSSTHAFGHGAAAGPGTFRYQLWFRNTPATFCDAAAAFNLSNGRSITW